MQKQEQNTPDNTSNLQAIERTDNGQFKKGYSGNIKGRPYGVRNKISSTIQQIFENDASEIAYKLVELAKGGDLSAIKLILERVYPAPKNKELYFTLPKINDKSGIDKAKGEIQQAFVNGEIASAEAKEALEFLNVAENSNKGEFDLF